MKRKVVLSLYYGIYNNQRVYTSLDCESKSECNTPKDENYHHWENCPAYKIYINPESK